MMRAGGEERKKASQLLAKFRNLEIRSKGLLWDRGNEWKVKDPLLGYPNFTQMRSTESSVITGRLIAPKLLSHAHFASPLELFEKEFVNSFMKGLVPFNATKMIAFNQLSNYIIPTLGDRVEMANSVECRTPFLDRDLVDFTGSVPPSYFMNIDELREKHLLREAFQGMLPEFLWKEHKHPFLSPNWQSISQSGPGQEICAEFLSVKSIREAQMFTPIYVELLKLLWHTWPRGTALWRKLDALMGLILSLQGLHHLFVKTGVNVQAHQNMKNRSWPSPQRQAFLCIDVM
jgi:asparagine synthase (glutamine-hydrolysing)